jgi:nicotinamide-nucleotide amidase
MKMNELAIELVELLKTQGKTVTTVESCTGGLIAGAITSVSGSSAVFEYGWVTYSNEAKTALVGVPAGLFAEYGAVSEEVARAMADGALARSGADIALSVTGIAGPTGATPGKPVGMVCFGLAKKGSETRTQTQQLGNPGRDEVRRFSVELALNWAIGTLGHQSPL